MTLLNTAKLIGFAATIKAEKAKDFYANTLGLALVDESPFALVFDANGTMLRVQKFQTFSPAAHTALGWGDSDLRATVTHLAEKGIRCERFEDLPQDDLGIWSSPYGASIAWFKIPTATYSR